MSRCAGLPLRPTAKVTVSVAVTLVEIWYRSDHHQLAGLAPGGELEGTGTSNRIQWPLKLAAPPVVARIWAACGKPVWARHGTGGLVRPPVAVHGAPASTAARGGP